MLLEKGTYTCTLRQSKKMSFFFNLIWLTLLSMYRYWYRDKVLVVGDEKHDDNNNINTNIQTPIKSSPSSSNSNLKNSNNTPGSQHTDSANFPYTANLPHSSTHFFHRFLNVLPDDLHIFVALLNMYIFE